MPDRRHLFRGIHDHAMVREGVTISTTGTDREAVLTLRSTGVGHRFPTYIVPRITLRGVLVDEQDRPVPGSQREKIIQRQVNPDQGHWTEISDTRLQPGESLHLAVPWLEDASPGTKIRFEIWVDPDHFYRSYTYPRLLEELPAGNSRRLILQALDEARNNRYLLFSRELDTRELPHTEARRHREE